MFSLTLSTNVLRKHLGSTCQYLDKKIRSQPARWPTRVAVCYLYRRYHTERQPWMDSTKRPGFLPVSETPHSLNRLTVPSPDTSPCSWSIHCTPFTSVSWRKSTWTLTDPLPISDGFIGWGKRWPGAVNKVKSDLPMVAGATAYGISEFTVRRCPRRMPMFSPLANAAEEFLVRRSPLYQWDVGHSHHWNRSGCPGAQGDQGRSMEWSNRCVAFRPSVIPWS